MSAVKVLKTKHTGENKVRVPRTYPGKSPLFGYIKKIDGRWAVFNLETGFRLTEHTTRQMANQERMNILHGQPELRSKIGIKQKSYEKKATED